MPIYLYKCDNCGVQFEKRQKFSDPALVRCPECSKKSLRKVFQPVGIVFKGSGFYATDNRSPSGASRTKSESKSSGNQDSKPKTEQKTDSSPEKTKNSEKD